MRSLIIILLLASPAWGQGLPVIPREFIPPRPTYSSVAREAVARKMPLVVFVDCRAPRDAAPAGYFVYECGAGEWWDLTKTLERGVVVSIPVGDWLSSGADWLPANSTWGQIQAEISRVSPKEVRRAPAPFYPSPRYRNALLYGETADAEPKAAGPWPKGMPFIRGLVSYKPARYTQSIFTSNGAPAIDRVPRTRLEAKWQVPGGMEGLDVRSDLYKLIPDYHYVWRERIPVTNGFGFTQYEVGYRREYQDGTLFVDVLSHRGKVFETRAREKVGGEWHSYIAFRDRKARPAGYHGLRQACVECHGAAGTGGYAVGMVPGGDGVLSDPIHGLE